MKKIFGILAIIALVGILGYGWLTISNSAACNNNEVSIGKDAPPITTAPYVVNTSSRSYYAADMILYAGGSRYKQDEAVNYLAGRQLKENEALYLNGFYEVEQGRWVLRSAPLTLDIYHGKVTVTKRGE